MSHSFGIRVDRNAIPQRELNIENKRRGNPLKWRGQFSPQLVEVLMAKFSKTSDIILDPFAGSGTVLLEASKRGNTVYGTEINPAGFILCNLYSFVNVSPGLRKASLMNVDYQLDRAFALPMFAKAKPQETDEAGLKARLRGLMSEVTSKTEGDLVRALVILLDLFQPNLSEEKIFKTWLRIKHLVINLPYSYSLAKVFHSDARCIPLPDQSVDLIITSPPYINVFNYHQQYRASAEFLHWDLLKVAKSEIGSNRKHRGNRFLTVIQYCLDLAQCVAELQRVCKCNSRIIFVIGRLSTVRGISFYNGEILSEVVLRSFDSSLNLRQERKFRNRFGQQIFEDILHFSFRGSEQVDERKYLSSARAVAEQALLFALEQSADETTEGLQDALHNLTNVSPSPLYESTE